MQPFTRVDFEELCDEVGGETRDGTRDAVVSAKDELVEGVGAFVLEGQEAAEHEVEDYAEGPEVGGEGLVGTGLDDLGGGVAGGTARSCESRAEFIGI